jgi:hypothetical protein
MRRLLFAVLTFSWLVFGAIGYARAENLTVVTGPPFIGIPGVTSQSVFSFDSVTPGSISTPRLITGLQSELIIGIDRRPATGQLYGVTTANRIYTIDAQTGAATFVSVLNPPPGGSETLVYGVDFNPTQDRLRVANFLNNQNLLVNVDTGGYISGGSLPSGNAVGFAYTNNLAGAASTALYGINNTFFGSSLFIQNPDGTFSTVGSLGVAGNVGSLLGFDISGSTGTAYVALSVSIGGPLSTQLYTVNLNTGAATLAGTIGDGRQEVIGLAAPVGMGQTAPIPEPASVLLLITGLAGVGAAVRKRRKTHNTEA